MAAKNTATLSAKFQISIPKSVREAQRWEAGQVFVFLPKGDAMLLVPVPKPETLVGIARKTKSKNHRDRNDRF